MRKAAKTNKRPFVVEMQAVGQWFPTQRFADKEVAVAHMRVCAKRSHETTSWRVRDETPNAGEVDPRFTGATR